MTDHLDPETGFSTRVADWLSDAVIYQIYPQSFADSDGDGVGDLRGVIDHLDHVASLGVDAIWFNPCFDSPFVDAGYDVRDYLRIAPRYGTNDDLVELVEKAGQRGIRVLLDLVAGHTSVEHAWFQQELRADGPDPVGDRYVWRDTEPSRDWDVDLPGVPAWVESPGPRRGWYLKNFFDEQPALNFGWVDAHPDEPWRDAVDGAGPRRNIQALKDIMSFWLDRGVAGFRVDMAFSLVKGYDLVESHRQSAVIWQGIREWLDDAYPGTVLIPEGSEPRAGGPLAFDADFFLTIFADHASLFDNGAAGVLPFQEHLPPFFDAAGAGSTATFLRSWHEVRSEHPDRRILLATAEHDFDRLCCGPRTVEQLGAALTFLLTWGSVPSIYYGDEIGMRYLPDAPDVEGAVCNPLYKRAGGRTPMQWNDGVNAGFSLAPASALCLPVDPDPSRLNVAAQEGDPDSTLNLVRRLIRLRKDTPALRTRATIEVLADGYPFVYVRGGTHLVAVNPRREAASFTGDVLHDAGLLLSSGAALTPTALTIEGFGYAVMALGSATHVAGVPSPETS